MEQIIIQLLENGFFIYLPLGLMAVIVLLVIMRQLIKLNHQLTGVSTGIKAYMDDVCREEDTDTPMEGTFLTSEEKKMLLSNERDEQIFNEVLQEIFQ